MEASLKSAAHTVQGTAQVLRWVMRRSAAKVRETRGQALSGASQDVLVGQW